MMFELIFLCYFYHNIVLKILFFAKFNLNKYGYTDENGTSPAGLKTILMALEANTMLKLKSKIQ
jgi:hypothetical protein